MVKIMKSRYGDFDFTEYPIIVYKPAPHYPSLDDVRDTMSKYKALLKNTTGKFVLVVDSSDMNWLKSEQREYMAVGFQNLEREFSDRYMMTFFTHKDLF